MRTLTRLGFGAALTTAVLAAANCSNNGTASTPDLAMTTPADLATSSGSDIGSFQLPDVGPLADLTGSTVVRVSGGFAQPFGAFYDDTTKAWYVSNVAGDLSDLQHLKDGRGWITKISADYKTVDHNFFATGLNAPAGMRIVGGKLYVPDADALVVIDLAARTSVRSAAVPASFGFPPVMIDVVVDSTGAAYVPETVTARILKFGTPTVAGAAFSSSYSASGVSFPSTLYIDIDDPTKLVVGTIGNPMTTGSTGLLYKMNLADGKSVAQLGTSAANFQGIEKDGTSYLVATQRAHTVNKIAQTTGASTLLQDIASEGGVAAVDIGWDPINRILAVPDTATNCVYFYKK